MRARLRQLFCLTTVVVAAGFFLLSTAEAQNPNNGGLANQVSQLSQALDEFRFQSGSVKAVKGTVTANPAANDCEFIRVTTDNTSISGRVAIGVNRATADFVQAEGSLGGVRFGFVSIGQFGASGSSSAQAEFISEGPLTIVICERASDGEEGPIAVRYHAFYTSTDDVTERDIP